MTKGLLWSDRALYEYRGLLEYIQGEWGQIVRERVMGEFEAIFLRIQNLPEQFPIFNKKKKIRRCVASPQTSIYFKVHDFEIEIYAVYGNRRNPRKLKL